MNRRKDVVLFRSKVGLGETEKHPSRVPGKTEQHGFFDPPAALGLLLGRPACVPSSC